MKPLNAYRGTCTGADLTNTKPTQPTTAHPAGVVDCKRGCPAGLRRGPHLSETVAKLWLIVGEGDKGAEKRWCSKRLGRYYGLFGARQRLCCARFADTLQHRRGTSAAVGPSVYTCTNMQLLIRYIHCAAMFDHHGLAGRCSCSSFHPPTPHQQSTLLSPPKAPPDSPARYCSCATSASP